MNIYLAIGVVQAVCFLLMAVISGFLKYPYWVKADSAADLNLRYVFSIIKFWTFGAVYIYIQFRVGEAIVNYFGWG